MSNAAKNKTETGTRGDDSGGILAGIRLDPAVAARRSELIDPALCADAEDRLVDFAARLDALDSMGDFFGDTGNSPFGTSRSAAGAAPAVVSPQHAVEPEDDAPVIIEDAASGEDAGSETDAADHGLPSLLPPGADAFEEIFGSDDGSEAAAADAALRDDEDGDAVGASDTAFENHEEVVEPDPEDLPPEAASALEDRASLNDDLPFAEDLPADDDLLPADGFRRIDEDDAEVNARLSGAAIGLGDGLLPDGEETAQPDADEDWLTLHREDDEFEEQDGAPMLDDDLGVLDGYLALGEVPPASADTADAGLPQGDAPTCEDFSGGDDVDTGESAAGILPGASDDSHGDAWEAPMTNTGAAEEVSEDMKAPMDEPAHDEDPLAFLDEPEQGSVPVAEQGPAIADPIPAAEPVSTVEPAAGSAKKGFFGFGRRRSAKALPPDAPTPAVPDVTDEVAAEPEAPEAVEVPVRKASAMPVILASAGVAAAIGFGLFGVVGMFQEPAAETAGLATELAAAPAETPAPAADPTSADPPPGAEATDPVQEALPNGDTLSQELAELRDETMPVPPATGEEAGGLDEVARGLAAAADSDMADLMQAPKAPSVILTQEMFDGLAQKGDVETMRAAIEKLDGDLRAASAAAAEREAAFKQMNLRMAEVELVAKRAETLALAQNEVLVDVVRLQEQMQTAETLIVEMSKRLAALESADPADRASVERSIEDLDRRMTGLARDVGLVARMALNGRPAGAGRSAPLPPGADAVYERGEADLKVPGAGPVPADVKKGDFVQGYGPVTDIIPTSDGSRLVIMENGSVLIH
ncbi:hypothetical protein LAZ40_11530 [Cereibacter sphaeroides]|uniref:hypothetical protein n=1 Tax=Cereibacter sphaeroides TaxID=1063 RepID=UPI001F29999D|nr:hypothetical protein [Cereibacter sphaeroides]MCE6959649.1 hypothetical protein [Cereibacter sphaeroides]MCE6974490.1 hypothetical protein [Cereibacter sphaeroides]